MPAVCVVSHSYRKGSTQQQISCDDNVWENSGGFEAVLEVSRGLEETVEPCRRKPRFGLCCGSLPHMAACCELRLASKTAVYIVAGNVADGASLNS